MKEDNSMSDRQETGYQETGYQEAGYQAGHSEWGQDNIIPIGVMHDLGRINGIASPETKAQAVLFPAGRRRIVSKIWKAAEKQVAEIECRLSDLRDDPVALERDAKTLSVIARTVRDLVALEAELPASKIKESRNEDAPQAAPRDIASFRAELAQKLDQLRQEGHGASIAGTAQPGATG
jgi:hypothetical protein